MINEENTERIDQYLQGELKDKDLEEFKARMKSDPDFRREVTLQQKIVYAVAERQRDLMKARINKFFRKRSKKKRKTGCRYSLPPDQSRDCCSNYPLASGRSGVFSLAKRRA